MTLVHISSVHNRSTRIIWTDRALVAQYCMYLFFVLHAVWAVGTMGWCVHILLPCFWVKQESFVYRIFVGTRKRHNHVCVRQSLLHWSRQAVCFACSFTIMPACLLCTVYPTWLTHSCIQMKTYFISVDEANARQPNKMLCSPGLNAKALVALASDDDWQRFMTV